MVNTFDRLQDFQWSGARLLLHHTDPWEVYLAGDPKHELFGTQIPNYLAILYVLIVPLGFLSMDQASVLWGVSNVCLAVGSALLAARFYGIRGWSMVGIVCALLIATPTRNTIGNGQMSLLVLFCWCCSLLGEQMSGWRAGVAGIGYFKYTFAPPSFLYLWARVGWRAAMVSLLPALAAVVIAWFWLTGGHDTRALVRIGFEPFRVAQTGYIDPSGDPNLMSVMDQLFSWIHLETGFERGLELLAALGVSTVIALRIFPRRVASTVQGSVAVMATMSFVLFMHHSYDGVVLLFPLCYAWRLREFANAKWILGLLAFILYVQRAIDLVASLSRVSIWVEFVVLSTVLVLTCKLNAQEHAGVPSALEPATNC
jgi:hypothetical protein